MINFLIDLGNSNCKVAFEEKGVLTEIHRSSQGEDVRSFVLSFLEEKSVDVIVFSNVREDDPELNEALSSRCRRLIVLDSSTELPINLDYQFPAKGLGSDRIAGALAVATLFPGKDCIKFDFGTDRKSVV